MEEREDKEIKNEHEYVPTKFDKLWDKITPYLVPILTLIFDLLPIYACVSVIFDPLIPAWWCVPILLFSLPVLYYFNKGSIEMIRDEIKRLKEKKKNKTI